MTNVEEYLHGWLHHHIIKVGIIVPVTCCWLIWVTRNTMVFEGSQIPWHNIGNQLIAFHARVVKAFGATKVERMKVDQAGISWRRLNMDEIIFNVDGSVIGMYNRVSFW